MASFLVVVDVDASRRARLIQQVDSLIAPISNLNKGSCCVDDFAAIWAVAPRSPVDHLARPTGAAILFGEAIARRGPERLSGEELTASWCDPQDHDGAPPDGYYAAVVYRPGPRVLAGADLLGLFPMYYWASGDVLLVGSSPELFRYHPIFRMQLDPAGLVGILLTNGLVDGQTLLKGVRRLAAGHRLEWAPGASPREMPQFRLPVSARYFELPAADQVALLGEAMEDAVARHAPNGRGYGLLLSGGLDSRMLGGFLKERNIATESLTFGLAGDIETQTAARVARALGCRHHHAEIPYTCYRDLAELAVKWEHLANGFSHVMGWGITPYVRELPSPVLTGLVMDSAIGPYLLFRPDSGHEGPSFENVFAFYNRWGVRMEWLEKLLRADVFEGIVPEMIGRLRTSFENYAQIPSQRAWCFQLHHRARFHVGSMAWQLSFGAWPSLPAVSGNVFDVAGGMHPATLANRHAQKALLCRRFPELAALPIDRNSYDTRPLQPSLRWLLIDSLRGGLWPLARLLPRAARRERRRFYRTFDIDNPGWRAVRRAAEPYRRHVYHLFNPDAFDRLLPPPDHSMALQDGIIDSAGPKQLLGFLLWSRDHL